MILLCSDSVVTRYFIRDPDVPVGSAISSSDTFNQDSQTCNAFIITFSQEQRTRTNGKLEKNTQASIAQGRESNPYLFRSMRNSSELCSTLITHG